MIKPLTPQQTRIAERTQAALNPDAHHRSGTRGDALYTLFAAAVINVALTNAHAAHRSCYERLSPALPQPTRITVSDETADPNAAAAAVFTLEQIGSTGNGIPGPDRGEAAAWFRTRINTLPTAVALAAEAGFDQQCWQLAAYCTDPLLAEGALAEAAAVSAAGLAAAERCRDQRAIAILHLACGGAATMTGQLTEAMNHFDLATPVMQHSGDAIGQANILLWRGAVHIRRGDLQQARDCQLNILAITHQPVLTALATGNLGSLALKAGDFSDAIICGRAALNIIDGASLNAVRHQLEVNQVLASAYLALGDLPSARRHADAALAAAQATKHDMTSAPVQAAVFQIAGRVALAQGQPTTGLEDFTHALDVRSGSTVHPADLLEDAGLAGLASQDRTTGLAVLHAALAQRRVDGVAFRTASTLAHLADAYQADDPQHARDLHTEAIDELQHLRDDSAARGRDQLTTA